MRKKQICNCSFEILISAMNIKGNLDFMKFIEQRNVQGENVTVINQITDKNIVPANIENNKNKLYSYNEKGLSKSRNNALEKASKDICLFADDDVKYVHDYKKIIKEAYRKNPNADIIIFYVESKNKNRRSKKIKNGRMNWLQSMKVKSSEISFKRENIVKSKIRFDENFGSGTKISNGEETIFIADCIKNGLNVVSYNKKIAETENKDSTWFKGYDKKYFLDRGAIFARMSPKLYKLLILQFAIRKHKLYSKKFKIIEVYNIMKAGAKEYEGKN
jgi:hypothetical protein